MRSLDRVDDKIIKLLGKSSLNLNQLWIQAFSREGAKSFKDRLDRLIKLNIINIDKVNNGNALEYIIKLKENYNG